MAVLGRARRRSTDAPNARECEKGEHIVRYAAKKEGCQHDLES